MSSTELVVRSLNGDLTSILFEKPHQELLEVLVQIWKALGVKINTWVFEQNDDEKEKIEVREVHESYTYRQQHLFVKDDSRYVQKQGAHRTIDLSRFSRCNVLFTPKHRVFLIHYDQKNGAIMCLDLNDLTFHEEIRHIQCMRQSRDFAPISNHNYRFIDVDSFMRIKNAETFFRAGPRVFESTIDKIDTFIASRTMSDYQPGFISKVSRTHFSFKPFENLV